MLYIFLFCIQAALIVRVLLRRHRDPASRMAWIVVILALPVVGLLAYILLGETNIGRDRTDRMRRVQAALAGVEQATGYADNAPDPAIPERLVPLFKVGQSISGYEPIAGNTGRLMDNSNATIDAMITDIDAARHHVHLLFYIWLPDKNGHKVAEALKRAVGRGVVCRAMVDDLGSRALIEDPLWLSMQAAGVKTARALPIGRPLVRILSGRIDLRNHRKILVVDNWITYCGSQNCADPEFLVKAKFAPWVDTVIRLEGPIARQNQHVFISDWMTCLGEDIQDVLSEPVVKVGHAMPAQVIFSGPTSRPSAVPEMFASLIYAARDSLVITTPYYAPDDTLQKALCAAANRGVDTTILFPARNDDWAVAATSRSHYRDLLVAGVQVYEYQDGLLHSKTLTMDDRVTLIGSANMDRRSFELNYENNILIYDVRLTGSLRDRQESYKSQSHAVTLEDVEAWPYSRVLWNNAVAMMSPVL